MSIPARAAALSTLGPGALTASTPKPGEVTSAEDRAEVAKQFEELLLFELLKAMRQTVPESDEGEGFSRGIINGLFDQAIAKSAAGSLGLGPMLDRQLGGTGQTVPPAMMANPLRAPSPARSAALAHNHSPQGPLPTAGVIPNAMPQPGDLPVEGPRSSEYGWRVHPITGKRKFHGGMDIAAPKGREIRSTQRGTVSFAGWRRGYGNTVEVRHPDGVVARYAHASRIHVRVGDRIEVGEAIADVGSTGQATGPHLHFEVRRDGHTIDPQKYLDKLRKSASNAKPTERPRSGVAPTGVKGWHES